MKLTIPHHKNIGCYEMMCNALDLDRVKWRAFVNRVIGFHKNGRFLY
jgi:hypothetical protein